MIAVDVRPATESDMSFIKNSYLLRMRNAPQYKMVTNDVFFLHFNKAVETLCKDNILVACNKDDSTQIFGYIIYGTVTEAELDAVHFFYVKSTYRKLGVARALIKAIPQPVIYTNHTIEGKIVLTKVIKSKAFYNPFLGDSK